jgi:beta-xylosidase
LKNDFTGLIPFEDGEMVKEITPEGYVEGPVMFTRNGKYYFMWSEGNWGNNTYKVAYAKADSPFGPFKRLGTVLESDPEIATGAGHHSVLNIPGTDDWFIVYHRRPIPNKDRDHRVICIDRMHFNADGTIKSIKMTFEGVEPYRILTQNRGIDQ